MKPQGRSWLIAAGAGALLWGTGLIVDAEHAEHAMHAYLAAYGSVLFCVLGALFFVLLLTLIVTLFDRFHRSVPAIVGTSPEAR